MSTSNEEGAHNDGAARTINITLPESGSEKSIPDQVKSIPKFPGVYLMRDAAGTVIYVGKAKDLRARVRTYFTGGDGRLQIEYLIRKVRRIDTIITHNENQAFVLERDLIAKHQPRYNIRLKDDKAYLNIRIDLKAPWPRLELVRHVEQDGARYFGPYSFSYELRNLLDIVKRVVPLRTCSNAVLFNRQRPCLEYQIKRCAGPCCLPVDEGQYRKWLNQAIAILEGRADGLVRELKAAMEEASADLRFEEAAVLRDRIATLESTKQGQAYISSGGEDRDVFGLYREDALAALTILRVRNGRIHETKNFSFSDVVVSDEEIVEGAISQFYQGQREIPSELVVAGELEGADTIAAELSKRRNQKVEISVPQRGVRYRLLKLAQLNARQFFSSQFEADAKALEITKELARILELRQIPRRIECLDISNLQGSDIVGAIVVFFDGVPDKPSYRRYDISAQGKPDDFAAVYEVVERRLRRGMEEGNLPDLLIIDGGAQQLKKALEARAVVGAAVEIVALAKIRDTKGRKSRTVLPHEILAKRPERFFLEGKETPIALDSGHPVTHFVQRIRDEVHRFVLAFHRSKRSKRVLQSVLDDIRGLGPARRTKLLSHFGSAAAIAAAPAEDIARAGRMPLPLAEKVLRHLGVPKETSTELTRPLIVPADSLDKTE